MWPFKKSKESKTKEHPVTLVREAAHRYELIGQEIDSLNYLSEKEKDFARNHARSRYLRDIARAISG